MSFDTDQAAVQELVLFTDNDGDLYRQIKLPITRNLVTKVARNEYESEKAIQGFMHLAEAGAKKYAKDFGGTWHTMFPVSVRRAAATAWRDTFEREAEGGEYDHLIPKKYQKISTPTAGAWSDRKSADYAKGTELAQRVSTNLSKTEIASIVQQQHFYGGGKKMVNPSADFKRGYLDQMRRILDTMEGN